ncbi:DNA-binding MarR family transcriptional regulator [Curtobacterium luteum]|uniref:Transcriptional regulator n=1 Tax=Curtobacterium luteum TaxID=33881 RepID=A0A8H9G7W6_9MICO|nr:MULTISPECIES: transcriptional regulator [Curtobacterium]MBM7802401.1 DNA-binding MarR family transcriptional regulator [Curtobacterium luteum]NUU50534.1 transcriptional regulator [Curtobacterium luteum]GGK92484.1 transcriptional regulator [Curtobacterium luteum]
MTTTDGAHPRHRLDDLLQNPVRFSVVAALDRAGTLGFREVRDAVEVTDSALSKQVSALEAAGYVAVSKGFVGKTPRTSLTLTRAGRAAWRAHLAALREIAGPPDADR